MIEPPAGWQKVTLGQIGRFFKGHGGSKDDETPDGIPCVRYGDLYTRHEFWITETRACVPPERASEYARIQHGDVLFAGSGETLDEIGKSAVNLLDGEVRAGGDILIFRASREVNPRFLGYACDSLAAQAQKARMGKGVTVMHVYAHALRQLQIMLPPAGEQVAIVRHLDHVDSHIQRLIAAKERLIELLAEEKQAVTHRAVTRGLDPDAPMKDSGVEWLGEVPACWQIVPMGRMTDVLAGFAFPSAGFSNDPTDIRLLRGANVSPGGLRWEDVVYWPIGELNGLGRYELKPGDIVLGLDVLPTDVVNAADRRPAT